MMEHHRTVNRLLDQHASLQTFRAAAQDLVPEYFSKFWNVFNGFTQEEYAEFRARRLDHRRLLLKFASASLEEQKAMYTQLVPKAASRESVAELIESPNFQAMLK